MINPAVADHLEVLRLVPRGHIGVRLIEGICQAHAIDGFLLDPIDVLRRLDARRVENGGNDVDDVRELIANSAGVLDAGRPRDGHTLPGAAEVRRDLLGPFERRVERP